MINLKSIMMTMAKSFSQISEKKQIIILLTASLSIILFLFFIDEGNYNFSWMKNIGNWIAFMFYVSGIFCGQILFSKIILKIINPKLNLLLSIIFGSILIRIMQ